MTLKEKEFCEFMFEENRNLTENSIYYKIIHTPDNLLNEIENNYPDECAIFHKYSYYANYWDDLREEFEKSRMLKG